MQKILSHRPLNTSLATLLLRLIVGGFFVRYGYMKWASYDQILPMFQDIIGIGSKLSLNLVIFAELICGFLVLIGCLTRLAIIPIFITMVVAYFIAHQADPFDAKALALLFLLLTIVVFVLGSGRLSVDGWLFSRRDRNSNSRVDNQSKHPEAQAIMNHDA